jgi:hypothetical protein
MPARIMAALMAGRASTTLASSGNGPKIWRRSSMVTRSLPFQSPATGSMSGTSSVVTARLAAGSSRLGTGSSIVAASRHRMPMASRPSPSQSPATGKAS